LVVTWSYERNVNWNPRENSCSCAVGIEICGRYSLGTRVGARVNTVKLLFGDIFGTAFLKGRR
jgi:hypothetical protein